MMSENSDSTKRSIWIAVLSAGALWGIFESTVGYLLHLLPVSLGFLIWFSVACFFLTKAYRDSGKLSAVLLTALMASAIKLLNLFLPGSIDRVINPAVSILFEGIALWASLFVYEKISAKNKKLWATAVLALAANCFWRLLFMGYLGLLVPDWMREVSVLRSSESLVRFLVIDNLCATVVAWVGLQVLSLIRKRMKTKEGKVSLPKVQYAVPAVSLMIVADIALQLLMA